MEIKKIQDVRKSGNISKQKVPFYDKDYVYQAIWKGLM